MGCDTYYVGDEIEIYFEDMDYFPCLCTFPTNNLAVGGKIDPYQVVSLALLGAMVVLAQHCELPRKRNYIPTDLPDWIFEQIEAAIRLEDECESTLSWEDFERMLEDLRKNTREGIWSSAELMERVQKFLRGEP